MATHCSILAWKIPWTEEPGGYSAWGRKELDTTETKHTLKSSLLNRQKAIIIVHSCQINKFSKTLKRKKKPQTMIV